MYKRQVEELQRSWYREQLIKVSQYIDTIEVAYRIDYPCDTLYRTFLISQMLTDNIYTNDKDVEDKRLEDTSKELFQVESLLVDPNPGNKTCNAVY